jgi:hypothetical protein
MHQTIRILVPGDDLSTDAISTALTYANEICKKGAVQDVILFVPGKDSVNSTTLSQSWAIATRRSFVPVARPNCRVGHR